MVMLLEQSMQIDFLFFSHPKSSSVSSGRQLTHLIDETLLSCGNGIIKNRIHLTGYRQTEDKRFES